MAGINQTFRRAILEPSNLERAKEILRNPGIHAALREWLVDHVASTLEMPPDAIDTEANLEDYGLDSLQAVGLAGDLQSFLGIEIPPTAIWDHATIESTCEYLAQLIAAAQSPTGDDNCGGADTKRCA